MKKFTAIFLMAFAFYLLLTAGSGKIIFWSPEEVLLGLITASLVGLIGRGLPFSERFTRMKNPIRWVMLLLYIIGPFFFEMVMANIEVAYRIITGKINPGIVKIKPDIKTDLGAAMLANSITLTPGTLSVDINEKNEIYVHWINVTNKKPKIEEVCGNFPKWIKRIAE